MKTRPISDLRTEAKPARESDAQRRARAFSVLLQWLREQPAVPQSVAVECSVTLPLPPSLLNGELARAGWYTIRAAKHQYLTACKFLQASRLMPAPFLIPWPQVIVVAKFYTVKAYDADNLASLLKCPFDFLKGAYFEDDNPACLTLERVTQERCGQTPPRVVIEMRQQEAG